MNCAKHPDAPASGYCRNCGKALCAQCVRNISGMLYCEDCLARVVAAPAAPAAGAGRPALAACLGFIPGLGAVYNGEYTKAIVQVAIFAGIITALSSVALGASYQAFLGIALGCFYLYMPIDSYRVAQSRRAIAQPAPATPGPVAAAVPAAAPAAPVAALTPVEATKPNWWVGPVILVVLGVLFLLGNFGLLEGDWPRVVGPLILIALGGWLLWRRMSGGRRGATG